MGKKIIVKENERIDDLGLKNLKIIQDKEGFCFGIDAVLLSDFAKDIKRNVTVLDLGTGTGVIATLLCGKTDLNKVVGIEIQSEVADMAMRSIQLNELQNKFEIINEDINHIFNQLEKNSFDVIVTNPPYQKKNAGVINDKEKKLISRHEITATLEDFIKVSKDLLRDKGEFYMVHRPDRLVDILYSMREYRIEPKVIRFVYPNQKKAPNLVLIKGVKNAKPFLTIEKNLYVYDEKGDYTQEIKDIYHIKD